MRDGRTDERTTSEDRATQLEALSLAIAYLSECKFALVAFS